MNDIISFVSEFVWLILNSLFLNEKEIFRFNFVVLLWGEKYYFNCNF